MSDGSGPLVIGTPVAEFEPRPPRPGAYRPDTAADGWSVDGITVRAASVRGYQHRHDGTPRQDDFAVAWHESSGSLLAAVADGVSSVELAHLGATLVCRSALDQLTRALDGAGEPDWLDLMRCASWALVEFAGPQPPAEPDEPPAARAERLLSTTLVAAMVRPRPDGSAVAEVARVGDSAAWLLHEGGWLDVFAADDQDLVAVAVSALPRVPADLAATTVEVPAGGVLLLGTDGVGSALGDGSGMVGAAFADGLAGPPAPLDFARLLDFSRETFDDDRTLVAVWPG